MNDVKITVGGAFEEAAVRRFVDAWHRAEHGQNFRERRLAFESWDAIARVISKARVELLRYVHHHQVADAHALAKALGRDYRKVRADVQVLTAAGLLDNTEAGLRADYDAIETKIAI